MRIGVFFGIEALAAESLEGEMCMPAIVRFAREVRGDENEVQSPGISPEDLWVFLWALYPFLGVTRFMT